MTTTDLQI